MWLVEASWALFATMLPTRSDFFRNFGVMLRHVGAKMATKSAKMNQHRRKSGPRSMQVAHPPRGEEVSGSLIIAKAIIKLLVVQI